jgi:hypothetical protein
MLYSSIPRHHLHIFAKIEQKHVSLELSGCHGKRVEMYSDQESDDASGTSVAAARLAGSRLQKLQLRLAKLGPFPPS